MVKTAPYGTWESPITADAITTGVSPSVARQLSVHSLIIYRLQPLKRRLLTQSPPRSTTSKDAPAKEVAVSLSNQRQGKISSVRDGIAEQACRRYAARLSVSEPTLTTTNTSQYGGAAARAYGGVIYFSNFKDGRVYSLKEGEEPEPVTPGKHTLFLLHSCRSC